MGTVVGLQDGASTQIDANHKETMNVCGGFCKGCHAYRGNEPRPALPLTFEQSWPGPAVETGCWVAGSAVRWARPVARSASTTERSTGAAPSTATAGSRADGAQRVDKWANKRLRSGARRQLGTEQVARNASPIEGMSGCGARRVDNGQMDTWRGARRQRRERSHVTWDPLIAMPPNAEICCGLAIL